MYCQIQNCPCPVNISLFKPMSLQAMYFDRDDVALPGFQKFFKGSSDEEREHAEKLMSYQNKRGGRIVLQQIQVISSLLYSECACLRPGTKVLANCACLDRAGELLRRSIW